MDAYNNRKCLCTSSGCNPYKHTGPTYNKNMQNLAAFQRSTSSACRHNRWKSQGLLWLQARIRLPKFLRLIDVNDNDSWQGLVSTRVFPAPFHVSAQITSSTFSEMLWHSARYKWSIHVLHMTRIDTVGLHKSKWEEQNEYDSSFFTTIRVLFLDATSWIWFVYRWPISTVHLVVLLTETYGLADLQRCAEKVVHGGINHSRKKNNFRR